jgi:hypothetical protein
LAQAGSEELEIYPGSAPHTTHRPVSPEQLKNRAIWITADIAREVRVALLPFLATRVQMARSTFVFGRAASLPLRTILVAGLSLADQVGVFARKEWPVLPFSVDKIKADLNYKRITLSQ